MSNHSLEALLKTLKDVPVTCGWAAVFAFSRERVNRMLEQQFNAAFNALRFISPCSGEVSSIMVSDVVFGAPVLSFETADLERATATVTVPIISGRVDQVERAAGRSPESVLRADFRADSGTVLTMRIDLEQVNSDSDNTGRITIDLAKATHPHCNLVADPALQEDVAQFLLKHLRDQQPHKTTFVLAVVDAGNYAALNPLRFMIRTQPAPGSTQPGARNAGDGAVLVFMMVQAYNPDTAGAPGAGYPYLIPDDTAGGEPLYTAALYINDRLGHYVNDADLAVLEASLLPRGYAFAESGRHVPREHAIFGNVVATRANVRIEPPLADIKTREAVDFVARRGDGTVVTGVEWSSTCLNRPLMKGEMSSSGRFSATNYPFSGPPVLLTTITARYMENGEAVETSAFVLVRYQSLDVNPKVSVRSPAGQALPLSVAGATPDAPLEWSLLAPELGQLKSGSQNGQAVYTPPANGGAPLVAQRFQARRPDNDHSVQGVVMLLAGAETLAVEPPFVSALSGQGAIVFEVPDALVRGRLNGMSEDDVFWRWSVVGEGTVVGEGRTARYTPPASRTQASLDVLVCELIGPGIDYFCGYSAVELAKASAGALDDPTWEEIQLFTVKAVETDSAFGNGMQQIRIQLRIETLPVDVDGIPYLFPISPTEINSLRLVAVDGDQHVPHLAENADGIEHGSRVQWATSWVRNRFNLYPRTKEHAPVEVQRTSVTPTEDGVTRVDIYLHLRMDQHAEFYAQFDSHHDYPVSSLNHGEDGDTTVEVWGVQVPSVDIDEYAFVRTRVWNGVGSIEPDDDFSYMLQSIDFWKLSYRRAGYEPAGFSTVRAEGNTSTIQWESELLDETFFSSTGWALSPKTRLNEPEPTGLSYDPYLGALMREVGHAEPDTRFHNNGPARGELIVSVHRQDDVKYWYDGQAGDDFRKKYRAILDPHMVFVLRDENGNRHRLQVGFLDPSQPNSRNQLILIPR